MNHPRRRRPTWAFTWPYIRWVREELRAGAWVELNIDPGIAQAYKDVNEVLAQPGTTADKKDSLDEVLRFHADTLRKLDQPPEG